MAELVFNAFQEFHGVRGLVSYLYPCGDQHPCAHSLFYMTGGFINTKIIPG